MSTAQPQPRPPAMATSGVPIPSQLSRYPMPSANISGRACDLTRLQRPLRPAAGVVDQLYASGISGAAGAMHDATALSIAFWGCAPR